MEHMTSDEIAHLTQVASVTKKEDCPHEQVVDQQGIYICLDCGMESRDLKDFK
ncbi:hypothetical protein [Macrococcus brunensis]|uniref:hypothetical protein n=1 Tax=Macrococcus brunensis TaxID=198483 RepID=UPI00140BFF09|nr:hypothetical protein [Macrococcus brunensis]ULG71735.1 hypothetical protein MGG12_10645 [Macrococcus brunensis]ULG73997.1 hypothetical protein MGG13_10160 [Macrococcus brunensis]